MKKMRSKTLFTIVIVCLVSMIVAETKAQTVQTVEVVEGGVTYSRKGTTNTATITAIDKSQTSLTFKKTVTIGETECTVEEITSGSIFSGSAATTITFDGDWIETDVTGAQLYNFTNITAYTVTNNNKAEKDEAGLKAVDGVLYAQLIKKTHLVAYPCKKADTSFTIPDGVKTLQSSAFRNNQYLQTINLNEDLRIIRQEVFSNIPNLTRINAHASSPYYETVDGVLFQKAPHQADNNAGDHYYTDNFKRTLIAYPNGKAGTSYEIPDGTQVLERSCFDYSKLQTITFADAADLIEIREFAFNQCNDLSSFTIPANVQYINDTYGADNDPKIPGESGNRTSTGGGRGVFNHCRALKIAIDPANPYFKVIDDGVLVNTDETRLVRYSCTKSYPGYIVPRTVENIDDYAFDCTSNLKHVVLPSNITKVSKNLFESSGIESITIPPLVTSIEQQAFQNCNALTEVFMMPETPPTLANTTNVFAKNTTNDPGVVTPAITLYTKPNKTVNNAENGNVAVTRNINDAYKENAKYTTWFGDRIQYDIPVKLNAYGMTTMCRDFAVELDNSLQAYYITNQDYTLPDSPEEKLTVQITNCSNTSGSLGRFVPARTGKNYGDYRGVILKTAETYNPSTNYTYQISVEDFANTFNLRGMNQENKVGYHDDVSFTFPNEELTADGTWKKTTSSAISNGCSGCTVEYSKIGGRKSDDNTVEYRMQYNGKSYQKLSAQDSYIKIIPNSDITFVIGDTLKATVYNSTGNQCAELKFQSGVIADIATSTTKEDTITYILQEKNNVSDISEDGSIKIERNNTTTYINSIQIISCKKANKAPRNIRSSRYIIGVPVETDITVYTTNDKKQECTNFGLKGTEFKRIAADGMLPYNKAYLSLPNIAVPGKVPGSSTTPATAKLALLFDANIFDNADQNQETTGITTNTITAAKTENGNVYNLQGLRVGDASALRQNMLPKGIYILNGKKYIVK